MGAGPVVLCIPRGATDGSVPLTSTALGRSALLPRGRRRRPDSIFHVPCCLPCGVHVTWLVSLSPSRGSYGARGHRCVARWLPRTARRGHVGPRPPAALCLPCSLGDEEHGAFTNIKRKQNVSTPLGEGPHRTRASVPIIA